MTANDLYSAAISADVERVRAIVKEVPNLLTMPLRSQKGEDSVLEYTVIFSILSKMAGNVSYPVLDVLSEAGADYNAKITYTVGAKRLVQPLLAYAIHRWHDPKLTAYLLSHGANPNAFEYNEAGQTTTILWYALTGWKNEKMTELLLTCGADPNQNCKGNLPPMYYALAEQKSAEKTAALIRYGARADFPVENTSFQLYIHAKHPELEGVLQSAISLAAVGPAPTIRNFSQPAPVNTPVQPAAAPAQPVRAAAPVQYETPVVPRTRSAPAAETAVPSSRQTAIVPAKKEKTPVDPSALPRHVKLYGPFKAYLFANFGFLALAFGLIGPLIYLKRDPEIALIFFLIGLPCFAIAALIWHSVASKAKLYGLVGVMPDFIAKSVLTMAKVIMICTLILIPVIGVFGNYFKWETRYTDTGKFVSVYQSGFNEYTDAAGNKYHEKE